jgi:hypothetical protein
VHEATFLGVPSLEEGLQLNLFTLTIPLAIVLGPLTLLFIESEVFVAATVKCSRWPVFSVSSPIDYYLSLFGASK